MSNRHYRSHGMKTRSSYMENASSCTLARFIRTDYRYLISTPMSSRRSRLLGTMVFHSTWTGHCSKASPVFTVRRVSSI